MTRPLAVGVQLPEVEYEATWPEIRDMALAAEDIGLDSLWLGDHLLYRSVDGEAKGPWEAWSMLAGLAAVTTTVQLGPLVAATGFHSPAMLAKKAATIQEISGGRLILGLGAGWNEAEYRAFGFPFDHRASRFEEAFTIIRTLLHQGEIDFSGRYYTARDCALRPIPAAGPPPIMIGSMGPRVLAATLPHVDMWNAWFAWYDNTRDGLVAMLGDIDAACVVAGRDPATLQRTVAVLLQRDGATVRQHGSPGRKSAPGFVGSDQEIAELLASYAAAGIGHVQLVLDPITAGSIKGIAGVLGHLDA